VQARSFASRAFAQFALIDREAWHETESIAQHEGCAPFRYRRLRWVVLPTKKQKNAKLKYAQSAARLSRHGARRETRRVGGDPLALRPCLAAGLPLSRAVQVHLPVLFCHFAARRSLRHLRAGGPEICVFCQITGMRSLLALPWQATMRSKRRDSKVRPLLTDVTQTDEGVKSLATLAVQGTEE